MDILQTLCSTPTAPFAEWKVVEYVRAFVAKRKNLSLTGDAFGNVLIELKTSRGNKFPRWVFSAHMDHPGFVATRVMGVENDRLKADFRGAVKAEYIRGTPVVFFDGNKEIRGTVSRATEAAYTAKYEPPEVPNVVTLHMEAPVGAGSPGMFDQGEGRYEDGKFYCRGIDDLGGVAACLKMLDELHNKSPKSPIAVFLTRAEEEGFIGCIAACQHPELLKKTDRIIAIECSSVQPFAPQGEGVIIRVGDRTSIFNSALTYFMQQQADVLVEAEKTFKYQRALMPGGTCEGTVYDAYGYTAASLCVALGNYHNMDVKEKKIGPEFIDVSDWENMVKLFVRVAEFGHEFEPGHAALKWRLMKRYNKQKHLLI
jgi:putative aminopeptidase FrvX